MRQLPVRRLTGVLLPALCALLGACAGGSSDPGPGGSPSSAAGSAPSSGGSGTGGAAQLAARLGRSSRFLVGLGTGGVSDMQSPHLTPDICEVCLGVGDWT
jgi:hypothetical protein